MAYAYAHMHVARTRTLNDNLVRAAEPYSAAARRAQQVPMERARVRRVVLSRYGGLERLRPGVRLPLRLHARSDWLRSQDYHGKRWLIYMLFHSRVGLGQVRYFTPLSPPLLLWRRNHHLLNRYFAPARYTQAGPSGLPSGTATLLAAYGSVEVRSFCLPSTATTAAATVDGKEVKIASFKDGIVVFASNVILKQASVLTVTLSGGKPSPVLKSEAGAKEECCPGGVCGAEEAEGDDDSFVFVESSSTQQNGCCGGGGGCEEKADEYDSDDDIYT